MSWSEGLEALSYLVTILGLPLAIGIFVYEQRKRRQIEENSLSRMLSEEYDNFLRLALQHADLSFFRRSRMESELSEEQIERKHILFTILISLFEKAYIILYNKRMTKDTRRLWLSWEDDMREWCRREDFRLALPGLLEARIRTSEPISARSPNGRLRPHRAEQTSIHGAIRSGRRCQSVALW